MPWPLLSFEVGDGALTFNSWFGIREEEGLNRTHLPRASGLCPAAFDLEARIYSCSELEVSVGTCQCEV